MILSRRLCLILLTCSVCLVFVLSAFAGEVFDQFDSAKLEDVWEVRAVGDASYEINGGQLIMDSPAVEDGILLAYVPEIPSGDVTFEYQIDMSQGGDISAQIWFSDVPLTPDVNTDVNSHWILVQTIMSATTYVKTSDGTKVIPDTPVDAGGANVYKFEFVGNDFNFYVNGDEIGTSFKPDDVNYFHIGPDMYTSHYAGRLGILDYVKISGLNVKSLAVEPADKLAVKWAELKK